MMCRVGVLHPLAVGGGPGAGARVPLAAAQECH